MARRPESKCDLKEMPMIGYRNPPRYQIGKVMKNPSGLMLVDVGPGFTS